MQHDFPPRRRRWPLILIVLIAVLAAAWSGVWHYAAGLAENTIAGWREREAITFPIRPYLQKKGIDFIAQRATRIDADGNQLELADGSAIDYDYLVVTTGPKLAFDEVPGAGPDANTQSVCTVDHAEKAWGAYRSS